MVIKVMLLNLPSMNEMDSPSNMKVKSMTINEIPTLHDYHCIIMDTEEVLEGGSWEKSLYGASLYSSKFEDIDDLLAFIKDGIKEQIETGGITLCFSSGETEKTIRIGSKIGNVSNYLFCPIDLGVVSEEGDTFYAKYEALGCFTPLLRKTPLQELTWKCYFSNVPEGTRVLGNNRAGYSVFMEVPIGSGKLIMLPRFKDRRKTISILLNEVVPQLVSEEEVTFRPLSLSEYATNLEKKIRFDLSEIEKAKRLLYTKDKPLEKAVVFAFTKLGFQVERLSGGTQPDLRISFREKIGLVEVKGHQKRQANRHDALQILGYLREDKVEEKAIIVSDHEFEKNPHEREIKSFTDGAVQLAKANNIALVASVELHDLVMKILEGKLSENRLMQIREKIFKGSGLVELS